MYIDALTLAAVTAELRATIVGGRVQRVRQTSDLSFVLEIYAERTRRYLLLSAHPQRARVHLTDQRPSRGVEKPSPLLLLLRKYVVGGRVLAVDQPDLERVILLSIAKGALLRNTDDPPPEPPDAEDGPAEDAPPGELWRTELVVEPFERRANILLVDDDNLIMECVRRVPPAVSRRPLLPKEPYDLPPRQEKRDPRQATAAGLRSLQDEPRQTQLAKALVAAYRGVSPLVAREVCWRALDAPDAPLATELPWQALADALAGLFSAPPQPTLALEQGAPVAFAAYALSGYPAVEPQPSISAALDQFYRAQEQHGGHSRQRAALAAQIQDARARLEHQRTALTQELAKVDELGRLRTEGELILGFQHQIKPGDTALRAEGYGPIVLDPGKSAVENAQVRFRAYDKAKGALEHVPERLRATEARIAGADELLALLELAGSFEQIEEIGRDAVASEYLRPPAVKRSKTRRLPPLRLTSPDGFAIYIGRSASQNEHVTFRIGASDDLWLHVRGRPGAHVIIKSGGQTVPEATLRAAAELAAGYSSARDDAAVEVDIARRRLVRRVPDGPPGLVTCRAEQTLRVAPKR